MSSPLPGRRSPFELFRSGLEALHLALEGRDWAAAESLATEVEALTAGQVQLPPEQWRELLALHALCMKTMAEAQADLEAQRRGSANAQRARSAYGVDG